MIHRTEPFMRLHPRAYASQYQCRFPLTHPLPAMSIVYVLPMLNNCDPCEL